MFQFPATHVMFDFFGTLVSYSPSRTGQGYPCTYQLLRRLGTSLTYEQFLTHWTQTFAVFDRRTSADHREFSMTEISTAFLSETQRHIPPRTEIDAFTTQYLAEWNAGVRYLPGIAGLVRSLADSHQLAVVTNTHHAELVTEHLRAMGVSDAFAAVITSVEVGWRKPHPRIYSVALDTIGASAASTVFVGDTYEPDYTGPQQIGIRALLIDPDHRMPVPEAHRLSSIFDLPDRLTNITVV